MSKTVSTQHAQYAANSRAWRTCRDAIAGQDAVKAASTDYLPVPGAILQTDSADQIAQKQARYAQYLMRALYTNYAGSTLDKLLGAVFRKAPVADLPDVLQYMMEDCDGDGQSIVQLSRQAVADVLAVGRYGLLVDYPPVSGGASLEDERIAGVRARIKPYPAESIINWRDGLVVLSEMHEIQKDTFTVEHQQRYRVLSLDGGAYVQRVYDERGEVLEEIIPRMIGGAPWSVIPFVFIGAEDNKPSVDMPPLKPLVDVNLAHYRNSADNEESLFITGQPSLFLSSDLSVDQFQQANPNGVQIGARSGHFLGPNGSATLLQAQATGALPAAMDQKVAMMQAIGAKLTQPTGRQTTAEEARINAASETSALGNVASNVSEAIEASLEFACGFMGGDPAAVKFALNRQFYPSTLTAQDVAALQALADGGDISTVDLRAKLRDAGWIDDARTDEEIERDAAGRISLVNEPEQL